MIAIIMLIRIMFTTTVKCVKLTLVDKNFYKSFKVYILENAKKIHAAISLAALRLPKLNFPIDMAIVFWIVCFTLKKFLSLALSTK